MAAGYWQPASVQLLQQLPGSTSIADLNHSVEKPLRARFAFDRLGFVEARGKKWPRRCWQREYVDARSRQAKQTVTKICAQRDSRSHLWRRACCPPSPARSPTWRSLETEHIFHAVESGRLVDDPACGAQRPGPKSFPTGGAMNHFPHGIVPLPKTLHN